MSKRSPSRSLRHRYARGAERVSQRETEQSRESTEQLVTRPASEPHAAFAANASQLFGNRVVSAALWGSPGADLGQGDDVAGPESLIHSILALGAAGVHVGDNVFTAFGNDRLASVLSDGPGADPWAPELLAMGPHGDTDSAGYAGEGFEGADAAWSSAVDSVLSRRQGGAGGSGHAERAVDAAAQSGGRALPSTLRAELEARFGGVDFGRVEIHTDGAAQSAAQAIDAAAYTMGTDIWFGQGQFAPDTERGMHLLAHELTHVLQNMRGDAQSSGGEVIDGVAVSSPSDARELEAEAVAHDVMRGETPAIASDFGADLAGGLAGEAGFGVGVGVGDGGISQADVGVVAERTPDGGGGTSTATKDNETKFVTLPDGTKTELHSDNNGGYYITGPNGERLACDQQGNPTSAALDKMANDARTKGNGVPAPEQPAETPPGEQDPGTKKDEGGKEPGKADVKGVTGGGGGGVTGGGPAGAGPGTYAELAGGSLAKYANEKAWHDSWKAAGSKTQAVGGPDVGDRMGLVGTALLSGGADGFVQGAQAAIIDVVLNKATSKIPYAAGFIAMAQIAYDPKKWWADTVTTGITGKLGGGWDKLTGEDSDWIDRFEGVVNILEGLNNIIGLASTVCMIVAAAGFILSFICPALIPFVALAAKWGLLLGEINTVVGLGLNLMRLIIVVARSVQIAVSDADPETQAKRAEKLKEMMTEWTSDFTKRQGNKLAGKLSTKKDTKGGEQHGDQKAAPHGDGSAATQKKGGWKSRLAKIGDEVTGISQMGKEAGHIKHHAKDTVKMTKAFGSEKFGSREQLKAMQDIDPNAVSKKSEERLNKKEDAKAQRKAAKDRLLGNIADNKKALAANNEGKGLAGGNTATSEIADGRRGRADLRKRATDPDFWEGANKAERKSLRRQLEKSSNPADVELARQLKQGERRLKEFSTDKDFLPGQLDNAAVRVTTESALHKRGTVSPRGIQGVSKLEDSRGVNSAHELADQLGFEKKYTRDTHGKTDGFEHTDWNGQKSQKREHFVAAVYTPQGALTKSTSKAMADQIATHANSDGLYGKNVAEIQRNITRAMNTPKAPNEQAIKDRPDLYGSAKLQAMKARLESDLGANQQKTKDGRTLTEGGHNTHEADYTAKIDAIRAREQSGAITPEQAQSQRDRARNRYDKVRRGDSHKEFYDIQAGAGQDNPLKRGSARRLDEYNELPVVKRLDWGDTPANQGPDKTTPDARRSASQWFRDEVNVKQGLKDGLSGVKSGVAETARGMGNRQGLDGTGTEANGYGHQGTGGHVGQATGPVQNIVNSMFSSPAVDEGGGVKLDKEGKPIQVSTLDSVTNTLTGGLAGKDKHGEGGMENAAHHWVHEQEAKLKERLAAFDAQHISITGELADPPTQNESLLDTSAATWKEYDAEIERLRAAAGETEGLKGDADAEKAALEGEKALAEGNKGQIDAQKQEITQKKENQGKADQKIGEQSAKGGELGGTTGKVIGAVAGFVTGFMEMCGMIPSRLTSAGSNASKNAQGIKDGVQKTSDSATTTKEHSVQDKATVEAHRQKAETASQDTVASEGQVEALQSSIDAETANTEAGKQELDAASQDIDSRIDALEAKKEEEEARNDAAAEAMEGWADGHLSARTGEEEEGDSELEAIEEEAKEIQEKSEEQGEESGDAPVGDFPSPIEGTVYADLAGPAPARTPTVDASAFAQGAPLPEAVKSRMGAAFGQDFADVKVHTGDAAADAASGFNARAFAYGSDILFGAGQFAPGSKGGDELIAHELQHVVQQRSGPKTVAQKGLRLAGLGSFEERDADKVARTVVDRLHGNNPTDGDVSAPRRGRDPEAKQNTPGTPGAGGAGGGTGMSRGRSADGSQGERGGGGFSLSGSVNIGGVDVSGSVTAGANGVTGSATANGSLAGAPVSAQVGPSGANVAVGQGGSAKADPSAPARGNAAGPGEGRAPQGNHVEGSERSVRGTGGQGGGRKTGAPGEPGANGKTPVAVPGPNGVAKPLPGSPDPTAQVKPGAGKDAAKPGAPGEKAAAKGGGGAKGAGDKREDGKDKEKGALPGEGAANVDASDLQGGTEERGAGPGEAVGAAAAELQPGNPATAALGADGAKVLTAVQGGKGLFAGAAPVTSPRELPTLTASTAKLPKDQELQLQKTTGLTLDQHRQAVEQDTDRLRDEVKSLQDDAGSYGNEQKSSLGTDMAARAGEAQAAATSAFNAIAGSFTAARKSVTDAVAVAKAAVDAGALEAQGKLDAALPAGKTALDTAYEAGKKSLSELSAKWADPFNTMVDEESKKFGVEADAASAELSAQKADILKAWPTEGGDSLTNAENEARRNAASKGIDQAVADYKNGGKAKADAVAAQKPAYQKQVTDAVAPVSAKLETMRQDATTKLDAAHASATTQIQTDKTSANAEIDGAQASATTSLDASEKSAKGEVSAAQGVLESDIVSAQAGAESQVDAAVAGLADRYATWLQGVLDGIPADQPMQKKTAEEYLAGKRQELARFHQTVLDELVGVCDAARSSLAGTIASTTANISALGVSGGSQAGDVASQQVSAIQAASGTFATSMTTVGGAVDSAITEYVTPIPTTISAKVTETDTALQQKKADAAADIAKQAVAYGAELRAKIKTMVPTLTPMANAAAKGVRPKLVDRAEKVFKACKGAGTDENMLFNGLRGCTALQGIALENSVWPDLHGAEGGMRAFIEDDVDGTDKQIALNYLAGNTAKAAQLELDSAMHWYGDDEEQIEKVLRDLSPEDLKAMQGQEGWSNVRARLVDNLGGTDLDVTKALLAGNTARADAYRLRDKINDARADMDPDALHKALEGVDPQQLAAVQQEFHNIQNKVDPEATNVPPIKPEDAAKELGDFSTRHIEGLADVQGSNKNLAEALATKGRESDEAAIHRFEVERGREGGPEQEGLEKALYANPELQEKLHSPDPQVREKAQAEQKEREARIREGYAKAYGNGNANAMQDAMGKMYKDDSEGDTRRRMVQNMLSDGTNTPRVAADSIYLNAKAKTGTDEAAVKRALTGMRPDEVADTSKVYAEKHGNGDPSAMAKDLGIVERNPDGTRKEGGDHSGWGSELSGDDRREVEELMMGDVKYQTPQQKLATARLQKDWTVGEESTGVGRWMLSGTNERADLDRNFARMEKAAEAMNPDGTFKGATPAEQEKNKHAFEVAAGDAGVNAEDYRAAGDRTAGYVTTGIAVVGAVVITAATFGSGAPAGAALIAAAGAAGTGVASMGVNYAMKGGRYGWEQASTDLALTAVTTATAGGGAYLGAMNKGVGILANSTKITSEAGKKVVGQMIVGAGTGFINGTATTAATDATWDKGFSKGMKEVGIGGLKQSAMESVTNGVSTGIDESAWAKAMTNKNLLAGSFAKGTSQGVAGMTSAATGIGIDKARGKYKGELSDGFNTVAIEGAKQFAGGFGGNVAGKKHVEPWAQKRQQAAETAAATTHPTETTTETPSVTTEPTVKPTETTVAKPKETVTPVADTTAQPKENVTPVADTSAVPKENVTPVADTTVQPKAKVEPVADTTVQPKENTTPTVKDQEVHVQGDKDGMTAKLEDRTVVSTQDGAVSTHQDGTQEIRSKDGTLTRVEADGSHKTILPDGTIVLETASGDKAMITKDGQYHPLDAQGKPIEGANPTTKQREDSLISGLELLIASKKISQEDALRVIGAGDIDAQQKALGALSEHVQKQDQLLNSIIDLTKTTGPDGKPLVTSEDVDAAFSQKAPERALQIVEANAKNKMRDAQTTSDVNGLQTKTVEGVAGEHVQEVFDNITLGAGFAGISNEISQKQNIAANGETAGKRLVVGEANPWLQAKSKLGQKAGESEVVGGTQKMTESAQSKEAAFMQAKEHAENVELNRNAHDVGVYQGKYGQVETKPANAGSEWPSGAEVRVPVTGPDGKVKYLYAKRIDLAGGPGSARQLDADGVKKGANGEEHLHQGIISESLYAKLKEEGIIISGDQSFSGDRISQGDVVINYGGGASGAWGTEGSYKNASEITWLGRQAGETKSRLNTEQRATLDRINEGLKSTEPAVREQAIKDLNALATQLVHPESAPTEHLHGLDDTHKQELTDIQSRLSSEDPSVRSKAQADLAALSKDLSKISGPDGLTQNQLERLASIYEKTRSNDPLVREEGMRLLEEFTFKEGAGNGYLPRNKQKGAAFDMDLQSSNGGKISREVVPDIHRITYEINPENGKLMLRVEGKPQHGQAQGEVFWADKMVFSIGQDGTAKGGPGDILKNIDTLIPIVDTSGTVYDFPAVVGLQNPEGTIRVLGAASTSPSLGGKITNGSKTDAGKLGGVAMDGAWVRRNQSLQANHDSTPTDSKGVVGSFNHAMKMITAANKDQLIALASLPAAQQAVLLGQHDQADEYRKAADEERTKTAPE